MTQRQPRMVWYVLSITLLMLIASIRIQPSFAQTEVDTTPTPVQEQTTAGAGEQETPENEPDAPATGEDAQEPSNDPLGDAAEAPASETPFVPAGDEPSSEADDTPTATATEADGSDPESSAPDELPADNTGEVEDAETEDTEAEPSEESPAEVIAEPEIEATPTAEDSAEPADEAPPATATEEGADDAEPTTEASTEETDEPEAEASTEETDEPADEAPPATATEEGADDAEPATEASTEETDEPTAAEEMPTVESTAEVDESQVAPTEDAGAEMTAEPDVEVEATTEDELLCSTEANEASDDGQADIGEGESNVAGAPDCDANVTEIQETTRGEIVYTEVDGMIVFATDGESSCQLNIGDAGDEDPFTYAFNAIGNGIVNYSWSFGDSNTATGSSTNHTYGATGDYTITLRCTPTSGDDFVLTGNISITSNPVASFIITPDTSGAAPFDVFIVNQSSGGGLSYLWQVSGPEVHPDRTDTSPSYTFTTPGEYTITLTVTDSAGTSSTFNAGVVVVAQPPNADFVISPASGTIEDTFTINGLDEGPGPIDSWAYTVTDETGNLVSSFTGQGPHTLDTSGVVVDSDGTFYTITLDYSGPGGFGQVVKQVAFFPTDGNVTALFSYEANGLDVCFTNDSTGPWVTALWDFGDGTTVTDNRSEVCHTYAEGDRFTATLRIEAADSNVNSTDTRTFSVFEAPTAVITTSPSSPIDYGEAISFSSADSTGVITSWSWSWDADGDGTFESSSDEDLNSVVFERLGTNIVTLTVAGPGGSASAQVAILVQQVEITCDIDGDLTALVGATETYTAAIGDLNGRDVSYSWRITGPGIDTAGTADSISVTWPQNGSYVVTLSAETDNGASCTHTETVQVEYEALACNLTGDFGTFPPNTSSYSYNVAVTGDAGRTLVYQWFVNGAPVGTNSPTYTPAPFSEGSYQISVAVATADGNSRCNPNPSNTVTVQWSELVCEIGGPRNIIPLETHTYSADVSGDDGEALTYSWTVTFAGGGTQTGSGSSISVNFPNEEGSHTVNLQVTTADGRSCSDGAVSIDVSAAWPTLTCNFNGNLNPPHAIPSFTPSTETYRSNVNNTNGDANPDYEWYLDGVLVSTDPNWSVDWTAADAGTRTLELRVTTDGPDGGQNCSRTRTVTVELQALTCPDLPAVTATFPATDVEYTYTVPSVSNTYNRPITYTWEITGANATPMTGTGETFSFTLLDNNATYTVTYTATVSDPSDDCVGSRTLETSGVGFTCQGWDNAPGNLRNGSRNFSVVLSNPNTVSLDATWTITRPDGSTAIYTDSTTNETAYSERFSVADFGAQAGRYSYSLTLTDGSYTCSFPTRNINIGRLTVEFDTNVDHTAVAVGEEICLTNESSVTPGSLADVSFAWDFAGAAPVSNDETPACFTFDTPGNYDVSLVGDLNGFSDDDSLRFTVYGEQAIAIDYDDAGLAPTNIDFRAIGTNITGNYRWTFYNSSGSQIGTRTGQNISFFFTTADTYRAVVSGDGPLGTTSAEVTFTLRDIDDIRAAFRPSTYGALAPVEICFTDQSEGNTITNWTWNFGDGSPTLSYTLANVPDRICHEYTQSGQSYIVRLDIENAGGLTATASNVVRTYTIAESQSSFSIEPQGNGQFCFTPNLPSGVSIVGWSYQDSEGGSPTNFGGTGDGQVCNLFLISGTYLVSMLIQDDEGNPGEIVRPVEVDVTASVSTPVIEVNATCVAGPSATFVVTNTGDAMTTPDTLTISNAAGDTLVNDAFFQLGANESVSYTINDESGTLTVRTVDTAVNSTTDCQEAPDVRVSAVCSDFTTAVFTIRNDGGDMPASDRYTIVGPNGDTLESDSFLLLGSDDPLVITVDGGAGGVYTLTSDDGLSATTDTRACAQPTLEIDLSCVAGPVATLIITNTGDPMQTSDTVVITNADGQAVNDDSGASQTIQLDRGESVTYTVSDQPGTLSVTITGAAISASTECQEAPDVRVSGICTDFMTAVFTIRNDGGDMPASDLYAVTDSESAERSAGNFLLLGSDEALVVEVEGAEILTFISEDGLEFTVDTWDCAEPVVVATITCVAGPVATITISNTGDPMRFAEVLNIYNDAEQILVEDDSFRLLADDEWTMTIADESGTVRLLVDALTLSAETECQDPPTLEIQAGCASFDTATFVVSNVGGDMPAARSYSVVDADGIEVAAGTSFLLAEDTQTLSVNGFGRLTMIYADNLQSTINLEECVERAAENAVASVSEENDLPSSTILPGANSFTGIAADVVSLPDWSTVATCRSACVEWDLYHTNHTGDWEIFRLDGADQENQETLHQNLSYGEGENITDLAPSRSPNGEWIIFSSNRDGNWELYVAPTHGDAEAVQRVTYNTVALDTDPVWGPHQYVVFETTRDGNWELYLLDMETGQETRLTDHASDDVNPTWSPDGSKITFQSNRSGIWQLYEIDLNSFALRTLSDGLGPDVDAAYNNAGDTIAFRSYRDGDGSNSVIYLMNADGSNLRPITTPEEDATNHSWSPTDTLIGYQSNLDGDLDVYIYEVGTGNTRQLTDNDIPDYAPTWTCDGTQVVFTSDVVGDPNIFEASALPILEPGILVDEEALQLTFELEDDIYPENTPGEENASREGRTSMGIYGEQTSFLQPDVSTTVADLSLEIAEVSWMTVESCEVSEAQVSALPRLPIVWNAERSSLTEEVEAPSASTTTG